VIQRVVGEGYRDIAECRVRTQVWVAGLIPSLREAEGGGRSTGRIRDELVTPLARGVLARGFLLRRCCGWGRPYGARWFGARVAQGGLGWGVRPRPSLSMRRGNSLGCVLDVVVLPTRHIMVEDEGPIRTGGHPTDVREEVED
jgi:hypothetical protein